VQDLFDFIPVSELACSYEHFFIPPTYYLGKFKRDLGKRASSLSHMNTMQNFIRKYKQHLPQAVQSVQRLLVFKIQFCYNFLMPREYCQRIETKMLVELDDDSL
jgi:hypothetical protein